MGRAAGSLIAAALLLSPDETRSDRLFRLGASVKATLPGLLRIERDLARIGRRPA
jgi:hypothetical protein